MDAALRKVFSSNVSYRENGDPKTGPAPEALALRALQLGLSGPLSANEAARELAAKYGPQEPEKPNPYPNLGDLSLDEQRDLARLLCKAMGKPFPPDKPGE